MEAGPEAFFLLLVWKLKLPPGWARFRSKRHNFLSADIATLGRRTLHRCSHRPRSQPSATSPEGGIENANTLNEAGLALSESHEGACTRLPSLLLCDILGIEPPALRTRVSSTVLITWSADLSVSRRRAPLYQNTRCPPTIRYSMLPHLGIAGSVGSGRWPPSGPDGRIFNPAPHMMSAVGTSFLMRGNFSTQAGRRP
jgi:hypothetical protein